MMQSFKVWLAKWYVSLMGVRFYPRLIRPLSDSFSRVDVPLASGNIIRIKFHREETLFCTYRFNRMVEKRLTVYLVTATLDFEDRELIKALGGSEFSIVVENLKGVSWNDEATVGVLFHAYLDYLLLKATDASNRK